MREDDWQQQVVDLAQALRWRVAHFRPARTLDGWRTAVAADGKGFPDLVLVRGPRLLFVELKTDRTGSKLSPEQQQWVADLEAVANALAGPVSRGMATREGLPGIVTPALEVYVWRPSDWDRALAVLR